MGVAVVGCGYWGPNLVRNFRASDAWDLVAVCDLDEARAHKVIGRRSTISVETSLERLLARPDIDAIAVATPARTHSAIALALRWAKASSARVMKPRRFAKAAHRRILFFGSVS